MIIDVTGTVLTPGNWGRDCVDCIDLDCPRRIEGKATATKVPL